MEISFKRSPYHYEVDLEDYEFNKHIIQKFITDILKIIILVKLPG